ncbi:MAG: gluconolaconase, partial [Phenylobacterium sp.]|nr:gluconolaconase [Phenylobacterium sp.]
GKNDHQTRDLSRLFYATPDGKRIEQAVGHGLSYNGAGLSPDEQTLYVADTLSARLWAFDLAGPGVMKEPASRHSAGRLLATIPGQVWVDSLAVTEAGKVCVATLMNGGITTVTPAGATSHTAMPDAFVTNICFGGEDRRTAYITLSTTGRIARVRWPEPGLALNFNPY